jgi:hypothetical protein
MSEGLPMPTAIIVPSENIYVPDSSDFTVNVNSSDEFIIKPNADGAVIEIGGNTSSNNIFLNGGIQYNITKLDNDESSSYAISDNDYMILVSNSSYKTLTLPSAKSRDGKSFIIARKFGGDTSLNVIAYGTDLIDGGSSINLPVDGVRIQLISDGVDTWEIV